MDNHTTPLKCCTKCSESFPETEEYWHKSKTGKAGLRSVCKICTRKQNRDYMARNKPAVRVYQKQWRRDNAERLSAIRRERYRTNHNNFRDKMLKRRWENRELYIARSRQWYEENKLKAIEYTRNWQKNNHDQSLLTAKIRAAKRRAQIRSLKAEFTDKDRLTMLEYWGYKCAVCGKTADLFTTLAIDHWIPVSKGGATVPENLVPLCHTKHRAATGKASCNMEKGSKDAEEWLIQKLGVRKAKRVLAKVQQYFEWLANQRQEDT